MPTIKPFVPLRAKVKRYHNANAKYDHQLRRGHTTYDPRWREIRAQVLLDAGYECAHCKKFGDVCDHIDGNSRNDTRENYQCLCRKCHGMKSQKEGARNEY